MTILELIKKLLGLNEPEPAVVSPDGILAAIIKDSLILNLRFVTGNQINAAVKKIEPVQFEESMKKSMKGYISSTCHKDEIPGSVFILCGDSVQNLHDKMKRAHSDLPSGNEESVSLLLDWTEGNLFSIFLPMNGDNTSYFRVKREYIASDLESIFWGASDSVIYEIKSADITAYLLVPLDIWKKLYSDVRDKKFTQKLRSIAVTEYTGFAEPEDNSGPLSINILKPKEFILGRFFLPASLKLEGTRISSIFKSISIGENFPAKNIMPVSLDIKLNDKIYRLWYGFSDYTLDEFNRKFISFDILFKAMLRDSLSKLKTSCPGLEIQGIRFNSSAALPEDSDDPVILKAEFKINFILVNTVIEIPYSLLQLIGEYSTNIMNINLLRDTHRNRLICALSVNSSLFSQGISTFMNSYRGDGTAEFAGSQAIPPVLSILPFYEFIELTGYHDLKIIVQNFISPRFSTSYMRLFSIGYSRELEGGKIETAVSTVASDISKFKKFLSASILEEPHPERFWTRSDQFEELNLKTMLDLYSAVESDRLLLSARAKFILKNQFYEVMQNRYKYELEMLKRAGQPFAIVDGQPYILSDAISRVNDNSLCLALLESESSMESIFPLLTDTRKNKIIEDFEIMKKQYSSGNISAKEVVEGIYAVKKSIDTEKEKYKNSDFISAAALEPPGGKIITDIDIEKKRLYDQLSKKGYGAEHPRKRTNMNKSSEKKKK